MSINFTEFSGQTDNNGLLEVLGKIGEELVLIETAVTGGGGGADNQDIVDAVNAASLAITNKLNEVIAAVVASGG